MDSDYQNLAAYEDFAMASGKPGAWRLPARGRLPEHHAWDEAKQMAAPYLQVTERIAQFNCIGLKRFLMRHLDRLARATRSTPRD